MVNEEKNNSGIIVRVSGPLVVARGLKGVKMYEVVLVGERRLIGEVIELKEDLVSIQVYEETAGIGPEEPVVATGQSLGVELGPGLLGMIYDGIQRPLDRIYESGDFRIQRGVSVSALDNKKLWHFLPRKKAGEKVSGGDIIGVVPETETIEHRIMVPPLLNSGEIIEIKEEGDYSIDEPVARLKLTGGEVVNLKMKQVWPVRTPRPFVRRLSPSEPLITGQRVLDTFFPVAKGGTACIPGPFGSGKTVVQHQLAKWSDADIIVYVGCGERGNEMADVLLEFPHLKDPRTNKPLIERTVLVANTSNMPVAAREASVYTGITIAEYFRDMGYSVALMADSTSRWAEAMREMSGRLEEMPGEEGYPAYLSSRIAEFYERAGKVICLGSPERTGTLSVIGAVSPPGGDLSDPVVQATLRIVKVFWSLEDKLAYQRHFPAISWLRSYSLYVDNVLQFWEEKVSPRFARRRQEALKILQEEATLEELVRLVGMESLSARERLILETAKSIREDFLNQHAFDPVDTYASLKKQNILLKVILTLYHQCLQLINSGKRYTVNPELREEIARLKYSTEEEILSRSQKILQKISEIGKEGELA